MNPLDTLVREHVVPVMKAAGFAKKGRTFRLAAPNGDHLFMQVWPEAVDPEKFVFDVFFSVVPLPQWAFLNREYDTPPTPDSSGALAKYEVIPPPEAAHEPDSEMPFRSRWAFAEPDTRDACGRELARVLREVALPRVVPLLDRGTLLAETRINPNAGLLRLKSAIVSEIMLRIDDDPVVDVATLLDKAETDEVFPPIVAWARERLARRAAGA
ncbi:hypothetical protein [Streptomyces sp. NPDC050535]|uniref:hypothetical protein n=1 Tax=Streptomyces sp. NPDC050535 TaxID=3365626 RepID=UPI0037AC022D